MKYSLFVFLLFFGSALYAQQGGGSGRPELVLYGRGTYPGDDSSFELIRNSGFTTMMLSSFYIKSNGDVFSGDDGRQPIIHEGRYTGSEEWLKRVASLRRGGSVTRIEILLEGRWYGQPPNTYDFIRSWIDSNKLSMLNGILRVFKRTIGVDAICIDDESVYDSASIIRLGEMAHGLGLHMSLCPFTKIAWWKAVIDGSRDGVVDAVYLQCYDGGAGAVPADWVRGLGPSVPVFPIFLCRGAFGTCGTSHNSKSPDEIRATLQQFRKDAPEIHGAGIWQMADIKDYVRQHCAVSDPASGRAASVSQYLQQLKDSLKAAL